MDLTASFATGRALFNRLQKKVTGRRVSTPSLDTGAKDGATTIENPDISAKRPATADAEMATSNAAQEQPSNTVINTEDKIADTAVAVTRTSPARQEDNDPQPVHLTDEELRQKRYTQFCGEAAEDYTDGPARFVDAFDGVKECASLLMTMDLSDRIKDAIRAQRFFQSFEREMKKRKRYLKSLEAEVEYEIGGHKIRISHMKGEAMSEARAPLEQELEMLTQMLEAVQERLMSPDSLLQEQTRNFRHWQANLNAILEEVFIVSNLLEPGEVEAELDSSDQDLDFQAEFQQFCAEKQKVRSNNTDEESEVVLNATTEENMTIQPDVSPEKKAKDALKERFFNARNHLYDVKRRFKEWRDLRHSERQISDDDQQTFDLHWVKKYGQMTRELIAAEEALKEAQAAAASGGVRITYEPQTSDFVDASDDGYRMSQEHEWIDGAQEPIQDWLNHLPEEIIDDAKSEADIDELELREVDISDSASAVADGRWRKKIDNWQQACQYVDA